MEQMKLLDAVARAIGGEIEDAYVPELLEASHAALTVFAHWLREYQGAWDAVNNDLTGDAGYSASTILRALASHLEKEINEKC